ncbi:hypothetical protein ScPMuIL_004494 [Solemya velum]
MNTQKDAVDNSSWFGWEEVVLAIVTNIMMFPINLGLIYLFKKSRSAVNVFDHGSKPQSAQTIEIDNMLDGSRYGNSFRGESFQTLASRDDLLCNREPSLDSFVPTKKLRRTVPHMKSQKTNKLHRLDSSSSGIGTESSKIWSNETIMSNWPEKMPTATSSRDQLSGEDTKGLKKTDTDLKGKHQATEDNMLSYLEKLEEDLNEKDKSVKVKRSGSNRLPVSLKKSHQRASSWGSLKDILDSDDESTVQKKKLRKNASTSTLSSSVKTTSFTLPKSSRVKVGELANKSSLLTRPSESTIHGASEYGYTKPLQPIPSARSTFHRMDMLDPRTRTSNCWLPPCFVYVAYTLCFALSVLSITLVVLYGYELGTILALKWLVALVFSLVMSVFVTETLKSLTVAFYMSAVEKKDWDEDVIDIAPSVDTSVETVKDVKFKPLGGFALVHAMEEGQKLVRMNLIVRQFIAYIFYLVIVMAICYLNYSYETFLFNKHLENNLLGNNRGGAIDFHSIKSFEDLGDWSEATLPYILHTKASDYDHYGALLGVGRLRQIRGAQGPCQAIGVAWDTDVSQLTNRQCSQEVDMGEDRMWYGVGWDATAANLTWMYHSAEELNSYTKQGNTTSYNGGGYVQYLGVDFNSTLQKLVELQSHGWINSRSRAVFYEFSLYSASVDMVTSVTLLVEFPVTGAVFTSYDIQSQTLLWFVEGMVDPLLICQIFLLFLLLYMTVHIALTIRQKRCSYFLDPWNWHELALATLTASALMLYVVCVVDATLVRTTFASSPHTHTNFEWIVHLHLTMTYIHGWILFLLMLKVARTVRFIPSLHVHIKTLGTSFNKICGCFFIFFTLLCIWSMLGYLKFGGAVAEFRSFGASLGSLLSVIRGSFDFWPILDSEPVFSHFYFYSYYVFVYGLTTGLVVAVLCDAYHTVKSQRFYKASMDMQDYEMIEFMMKRFKLWAGITKPKPAFRKVKFQGLPSISSRTTSSYSNRTCNSDSTGSSEPVVGLEHAATAISIQAMMAKIAPSWEDVLHKFKKIEALDKEEDFLVKKAARKMEHMKSRKAMKQRERNRARISLKSPMGDHQRPFSKSHSESGHTSRSAPKSSSISPPFSKDEKKGSKKWRPTSDQRPRDNEEEESLSQEKSLSFNRFFRTLKRKEAWDANK